MIVSPNKWLVCYQRDERAKTNLICFPYGGAAASAYRPLAKELHESCNVWSVQLPGRENRFAQAFATDASCVVESVANEIRILGLKNYSVFGHSMGSDLAMQFCRQVDAENYQKPNVVILSGNKPPHLHHDRLWSDAKENELLDHVLSLGGIPKDALSDKDFAALYLQKIRHDYKLYESVSIPIPVKWVARLNVVYGSDDPLLANIDVSEWSKYSANPVKLMEVQGNHFYFQSSFGQLASIIRSAVDDVRAA